MLNKKTILAVAAGALAIGAPAAATWGSYGGSWGGGSWGGGSWGGTSHSHYCGCGHTGTCTSSSGGSTT
ncbi:MAG: hypothetical protein KDD90_05240, partial [Sphingomonadaceae bacterium]|nr:hypothetical protein [Sphingomonadaceae bacterium]